MKRIHHFLHNAGWLSKITGNRLGAVLYLLKFRLGENIQAEGRWGGTRFHFRKSDLSGVREVLVEQEYAFLKPALESLRTPVVLDCGGHIGLTGLWILSVNPAAKILSVEASFENFRLARQNAKETGADWDVVHLACWSDDSVISFSAKEGDSMSHRAARDGTLTVSGITLPALMDRLAPDGPIDLLKIDIEGAEEEFLCSHEESLGRAERLALELHPQLCDTARVEQTLRKYFSKIETIEGRTSSKPLIYCTK